MLIIIGLIIFLFHAYFIARVTASAIRAYNWKEYQLFAMCLFFLLFCIFSLAVSFFLLNLKDIK